MSTTTAPAPTSGSAALPLFDNPRVPMSRLLKVELRKITDTRAGKWLLFTIGIVTAGFVVIMFFAGSKADLTYDNFVGITVFPQAMLLPVLGILAITSEWSQRTGLVTFTMEPSRSRVVVAKFLAMILLSLAAVAVAFAFAAVGNELASVLRDGDGSWAYSGTSVAEITAAQIISIIQGLAFGMLFMSSAAAIVIYYVVPIAWSILFNTVSALSSASVWVDLGTASSPLYEHTISGMEWAQLGVTTVIWVVLPLMIGAGRLLRSEVK